ncbi:MAG: DUF932 domain-containing protein [Chloroflexia bacterium]|nr:DUF932 domain-containing protein [Chloroflexia bacterium]
MAHNIDFSNGRANMAYTRIGGTPWHGLGSALEEGASMEEWAEAAGFNWEILKHNVQYTVDGELLTMPERFVLYRSDTKAPLSIMSGRYREVQPAQVLDFFADVCESQRWTMETAGMLKGGAQYWALAKAGLDAFIGGDDKHELYMLLATSADGSLATSAQATDVRVVCNNTLSMALSSTKGTRIKIYHNALFDAKQVKKDLGMVDFDASWDAFVTQMQAFQQAEVDEAEARAFFSQLLRPEGERAKERGQHEAGSFEDLLSAPIGGGYTKVKVERTPRGLEDLLNSYHNAPGAEPGTAYGLINGVTHWLDHVRGRDQGRRLSSAWFGQGARIKAQAMTQAQALVAG